MFVQSQFQDHARWGITSNVQPAFYVWLEVKLCCSINNQSSVFLSRKIEFFLRKSTSISFPHFKQIFSRKTKILWALFPNNNKQRSLCLLDWVLMSFKISYLWLSGVAGNLLAGDEVKWLRVRDGDIDDVRVKFWDEIFIVLYKTIKLWKFLILWNW